MAQQRFQYDMQLKGMDDEKDAAREKEIEERKDKRTRIQGTQQSKMIAQRTNDSAPIDFEAGGGAGQMGFSPDDFTPT